MSFAPESNESDKSKLSPLHVRKQCLQKSQSPQPSHTVSHTVQANIILGTSEATEGLLEATSVLLGHSETFDKVPEVVMKGKTEPKQLHVIEIQAILALPQQRVSK